MLNDIISYLPACICFIWMILFLFRRKSNFKSQTILIFLTAVTALFYFVEAYYINGNIKYSLMYKLDIIDGFIALQLIPFLYLYFKSLTDTTPFSWKDLLIFMPGILLTFSIFLCYVIMGHDEAVRFVSGMYHERSVFLSTASRLELIQNFIAFSLYNYIVASQVILFIVYATYRLYKYHRTIHDYFSATWDKSLTQSKIIYLWAVLSLTANTLFLIMGRDFFRSNAFYNNLFFLIISVIAFGFFYSGYNLTYSIDSYKQDLMESAKDSDSGSECTDVNTRVKHLNQLFIERVIHEKIFIQPNLKIDQVAMLLNSNRTYVSEMINHVYRMNFSAQINFRRIEYAKLLMLSSQDLTQEFIARECGFANASNFNRVFKQHTGYPPNKWMQLQNTGPGIAHKLKI